MLLWVRFLAVAIAFPVICGPALCLAQKTYDIARYDIDRALEQDPVLKESEIVVDASMNYNNGYIPLWSKALDHDESDLRRQVADSIARASSRNMDGLEVMVPKLVRLLGAEETHDQVRRSVARALIAMDSRDSAEALFAASQTDDRFLSELIEPALAAWDYQPARSVWRVRINELDEHESIRTRVAARCLAVVKDKDSGETLVQLASDSSVPLGLRKEFAIAAGAIVQSGLRETAEDLLERGSLIDHMTAALLIRFHSDEPTIALMKRVAVDSPTVAGAIAVEGLHYNDPLLVVELLDELIGSPDPKLRGLLVQSIVAKPAVESVSRVIELYKDPVPDLRHELRRSMTELAEREELRKTIIDRSVEVLEETDWRGLEQSLLLLGALDHEPAVDRMVELLDHDRPEVFVSAAWGLRKLAVDSALPAMLVRARKNNEYNQQRDFEGEDAQQDQLFQAFGLQTYEPSITLLKSYIPKGLPGPRPAAIWALGLIYQDQNQVGLAKQLATRLADINSIPPEDDPVRAQCAVAIGRMGSRQEESQLRNFAEMDGMGTHPGHACYWALNRIFGDEIPPIPTMLIGDVGYPLAPIGDQD